MSLLRIIFEFHLMEEPLTAERAAQIWGRPVGSEQQVEFAQRLLHEQALRTALQAHPLKAAYGCSMAGGWLENLGDDGIAEAVEANGIHFDIHSLVAELAADAKKYFSHLLASEDPVPLLYDLWYVKPARILVEDETTQLLDTSTRPKPSGRKGKPRSQPTQEAVGSTVRAILEFPTSMQPLTLAVLDELWGPVQTKQEQTQRAEALPHEQALIAAVQAQPELLQKSWFNQALLYLYETPSQEGDFINKQLHGCRGEVTLPLSQLLATLSAETQHYFHTTTLQDDHFTAGPLGGFQQLSLSRLVFE